MKTKLCNCRCAILVGISLAVLLIRMEKEKAAVAVTGSLFKCHPRLEELLLHYVHKYAEGWKCSFFLSDDGSGKGAGLVAAIAHRIRNS